MIVRAEFVVTESGPYATGGTILTANGHFSIGEDGSVLIHLWIRRTQLRRDALFDDSCASHDGGSMLIGISVGELLPLNADARALLQALLIQRKVGRRLRSA